jgi:hypothetical protein
MKTPPDAATLSRASSAVGMRGLLLGWAPIVLMRRPKSVFAVAVFLACTTVACKRKPPTQLVIGVQSEPMGGVVSALHVVIKVAGVVKRDEMIQPPHGSKVGFPQPWEARLVAEGDPRAAVDVEVVAMGSVGGPTAPLLTRLASTHFLPGREELARIQLESRCIVYPASKRPRGSAPGPLSGPTCEAPATCIRGICQSGAMPPSSLEAYSVGWPANVPDVCKPKNAGPPAVQIGTGQTGYVPLAAGQTLQAEAGPQGGHHIWIATRMKNMKQAGSTTQVSAVQPGTNTPIPPSSFAFTFDPDEGGYCKLYGLRYQLDNGGIDYIQFLGKPLDVTTTVTDSLGQVASSTAHIQVAPTLLNQ